MSTPTNTLALSAAFVTAIEAIVPRFEHERVSTWVYTPGELERGTAYHLLGTELRSFDLVWDVGGESRLSYGSNGTAYVARLKICTSYSGVPRELRDHMIMDDSIDLTRMFMQLTEPTVSGFRYATYQRTGQVYLDDQANVMAEHLYDIHWCQDTA